LDVTLTARLATEQAFLKEKAGLLLEANPRLKAEVMFVIFLSVVQ
jgi:hypothetical protein